MRKEKRVNITTMLRKTQGRVGGVKENSLNLVVTYNVEDKSFATQ